MNTVEQKIQQAMFTWLQYAHHKYPGVNRAFAVVNEAARSKKGGAEFKKAGLTAGISDLVILPPAPTLFAEVKQPGKYQNKNQKLFEQKCIKRGDIYVVVRELDELIESVDSYYKTHYSHLIK